MLPLIEICEQNLLKGTSKVLEDSWIKEHAEFLLSSCLSECGLCSRMLYVWIDGERITASHSDELICKIKEYLLEING